MRLLLRRSSQSAEAWWSWSPKRSTTSSLRGSLGKCRPPVSHRQRTWATFTSCQKYHPTGGAKVTHVVEDFSDAKNISGVVAVVAFGIQTMQAAIAVVHQIKLGITETAITCAALFGDGIDLGLAASDRRVELGRHEKALRQNGEDEKMGTSAGLTARSFGCSKCSVLVRFTLLRLPNVSFSLISLASFF
jgi:hypothetical protein